MGEPHLAGLQTVVTAEDWTGTLRISSGIDGAITNSGVARYGDLSARHLTVLARREPDPSSVLLVARTTQSQLRIALAARTTAVGGAGSRVATALAGARPDRARARAPDATGRTR